MHAFPTSYAASANAHVRPASVASTSTSTGSSSGGYAVYTSPTAASKRVSTNPLGSFTQSIASSLPSVPSLPSSSSGAAAAERQHAPAPPIPILERNLAKTRGSEVATAAWALLFSEIIQYTQRRVTGIAEFEERLSQIGYRVGQRLIELLPLRDSLPPSTSRNAQAPPRQTRLLPVLHYVHTTLFKYLFGRPASSLEKSTDNEDEYMVGDDEPVLDRGVNTPKEMSSLSTNALLAGVVEAVLDGLGFTSTVTSHNSPTDQHPKRIVLLIKLDKEVMEREKALASVK